MVRYGWFGVWFGLMIAACLGCQGSGGFNPFAPYGATRIPPPSTGAIGSARSYDPNQSTAPRSSLFGAPGQQRPDLGTNGTGTANPAAAPEDQGWGASGSPAAPRDNSAPANTGPTGNPFQQSSIAPEGFGDQSHPSDLNWLDPRRRTLAAGYLASLGQIVPPREEPLDGSGGSSAPAAYRAQLKPRLISSSGTAVAGADADPLMDPLTNFSGLALPDPQQRSSDSELAGYAGQLVQSAPRLRFSGSYGAGDTQLRMSSVHPPSDSDESYDR
jgi:hypothetical protein